MDPILAALAYAAAAALATLLAAPTFLLRRPPSPRTLAGANALAGGLMLGFAYTLLTARPAGDVLALAGGAALGILFVALSTGVAVPGSERSAGFRLLLAGAMHAAHEGVAIGAATAVDRRFGAFLAVAIAVHNIPEAVVLIAGLRERGAALGEAVGLAVAANANQVALAVGVLALITPLPALLPWAIGFAVGALIHLVMAESLPESYRGAGRTSIALVAITAMGAVVLVRAVAP